MFKFAIEPEPIQAVAVAHAPVTTAVPLTQTMERVLGPCDVVSVQQTPRGCLQEAFGCTARNEFRLYKGFTENMRNGILPGANVETDPQQIGHMLEESPFFPDRCFWSGMRSFSIPITVPDENGEAMMLNEKDFSMPTHCIVHGDSGDIVIPCCCNLPTIKTYTNDRTYVGKTKYVCDQFLCVPKLRTYDANDNPLYLIRPETCCGGCCPVCGSGCDKGSQCIYMPFYLHDYNTMQVLPGAPGGKGLPAQIRNVWAGMKRECCTSADNYFVVFPEGASSALKAALLGSTVLLDFTVFEEKNGGCLVVTW